MPTGTKTHSSSRWAAIGAAVAVTLGAGGIGLVDAAKDTGERAVYTAIEPCRLVDTRPDQGIGGRTAPLGPAEVFPVTAHGDNGQCTGIPGDTVALELNVTGLLNTGATFFTIWDGEGDVPNASHINLVDGAGPTPNSVTTELDGADFAIFNQFATAHVIVDIVGIYQDHHHDDRYYTESEADAKFIDASQDSHAAIYGEDSNVGPISFASDTSVANVTVDTPTSGYVLLSASAYVNNNSGVTDARVRCSIGTTTTVDQAQLQITDVPAGTYSGISGTRGFAINGVLVPGGAQAEMTYHFVCDTNVGAVQVNDAYLTAVFVADPDASGDDAALMLEQQQGSVTEGAD